MKITVINDAYVREEIKRDCYYLNYVKLRKGEIEMAYIEGTAREAIVGLDPLFPDSYVCLAVDDKITWSRGYKTIRAAIKNARPL